MPKISSIKKIKAAAAAKKSSSHVIGNKTAPKLVSKKTRRIAKLNGFSVLDGRKHTTKKVVETDRLLSDLEENVAKTSGDLFLAPGRRQTQTSNKFTARTAIRETERMKLVSQNSKFQANPLEEAHKHLAHMLANSKKGKGALSNID